MPMRVAVLSDVHANFHALRAVLDDIHQQGIDRCWFMGDAVGRGHGLELFPSLECLYNLYMTQTPEDRGCWLAGNHDYNVTHSPVVNPPPEDAQMDRDHLERLRENGIHWFWWLHERPIKAEYGEGIYLAHGMYAYTTRRELSTYGVLNNPVRTSSTVRRQFNDLRDMGSHAPRIVINGHIHQACLWHECMMGTSAPAAYQDSDTTIAPYYALRPFAVKGYRFENLSVNPICLNPGSVAFPRNVTAYCPTYMVLTFSLEEDWAEVEFHAVPYDTGQHVLSDDYPPGLRTHIEQTWTAEHPWFAEYEHIKTKNEVIVCGLP